MLLGKAQDERGGGGLGASGRAEKWTQVVGGGTGQGGRVRVAVEVGLGYWEVAEQPRWQLDKGSVGMAWDGMGWDGMAWDDMG